MWLLIIIKLFYLYRVQSSLADEVHDLTEILFSNLNSDPVLTSKDFNKLSEDFINKQTENYIALQKNRYGVGERKLTKRSTEYETDDKISDSNGTYLFSGFSSLNFTTAKNASDIFFIELNNNSYLLTLKQDDVNSSLIFQEQSGENIELIFKEIIGKINEVITYTTLSEIFVILTNARGVRIYTVANNSLNRMQELHQNNISDIIVWENADDLFLAIARGANGTSCKNTAHVYKWLGKHFDLIHEDIVTNCAKSISTISVGSIQFLAVANYQDDEGNTKIYSEIFKYNIDTDEYEPYQKIFTNGAINTHFFSLLHNSELEVYLVVANSLKDENHIEPKVNSIVYKYVDRYFIPFQSIAKTTEKWIAITGTSGEFLLLSESKTEGISAFIYDGWTFIEQDIERSKNQFTTGVTYMGFEKQANNLVLKISNHNVNNGKINLYKLNFFRENAFKSFRNDLLNWCEKSLNEINDFQIEELQNAHIISPKEDITFKEYENKMGRDAIVRGTRQVEQDSTQDYDGFPQDVGRIVILNQRLVQQLQELTNIKGDIGNYLQKSGVIQVEGDIIADNIISSKEIFFESNLDVDMINDIDSTKVMVGLININEDHDFTNEEFTFGDAKVENVVEATHLNGEDIENLIHRNDSIDFKDVIVEGKVILNNGLKVGGTVNGVHLNLSNVILVKGDQDFSRQDVDWENIKIRNAMSRYLNKLNLYDIPDRSTMTIEHLDNLNVKKLVIGGKINGKDINLLNKNALHIQNNVRHLENCTFNALESQNLFVTSTLSNKIPTNALLTNYNREYDLLKQNVLFTGDISCQNLQVRNKLNNLNVLENGRLDVLLWNTTDDQFISGSKTFEDLKVINPMTLQVKIDSERLKNMNPIQLISEKEIIVEGDYNFTGNVVAEQKLKVRDMKGSNSNRTVQDIILKGLRLDEEDLPYDMIFKRQLKVKAIQVDELNERNPDDFVINGNGDEQYILGNKVIESDVHITGSSCLFNVNNIHIPALVKDIFYVDGDQEITGKHILKELIARSVQAANTKLGDHVWRDIVTTTGNQTLYGVTVINEPTEITSLKVKNATIKGSIIGYNFTDILSDTANINTSEVRGHKTFQQLQADNITVTNGINISDIESRLKEWKDDVFVIEGDIILLNNIQVEKMEVAGYLNDMDSDDFKRSWNERPKEVRIFNERYIFENVTVLGNAFILWDEINGVSFTDIIENTIKTNETFNFDYVKFDGTVVAKKPITLHGDLLGLDLENIVTCEYHEQSVTNLIFAGDITVNGDIDFDGLVNGFDYQHLCSFGRSNSHKFPKNLIIDGDAKFAKGLALKSINNMSLNELHENVWLANRETQINGHIEFEAMNFEDDVFVKGLVNEVDLTWLSSNYFSKTKNQTITANLDFTDGVVFLNGVSASEVTLPGLVSGVDIIELVKTAILNNTKQKFDSPIHIESCAIQDLSGDYLVNDMNLPNDVMRYDVKNTITGYKYIPNITTGNLILEPNTMVQNIDLFEWIHKSALKTGGRISGECLFHGNVTFAKGIGVVGKVNGITFDNKNILMKSEEQIISGKKTITPTSAIIFEDLNLKGRLNEVDVAELIQTQAHRTDDNFIETPTNFNGDLIADNLNLEGLFNNINVTKVITELSDLQDLNNYYENYGLLLSTSIRITESLENRGLFLDHYGVMQNFDEIWDVYYLLRQDNPCLAVVPSSKGGIDILKWNDSSETFNIRYDAIPIKNTDITYLSIIALKQQYYLYVEYRSLDNAAANFMGVLSSLNNTEKIIQILTIDGTNNIQVLILPDKQQECLIFSYNYEKYLNIYCDTFSKELSFEIHQRLDTYSHLPLSTLTIGSNVYILIVNSEIDYSETMLEVWKLDANTRLFNKHQLMYLTTINSISSITYRKVQYLAVSSGHLQDAVYQGMVQIYRFDIDLDQFTHWQDIIVEAPIQVELLILPSQELILYILSDNPAKPLTVYKYEGLNRFKLKHEMISVSSKKIKPFNTINGNSFVMGMNKKGVTLIRTYFQGYKRG